MLSLRTILPVYIFILSIITTSSPLQLGSNSRWDDKLHAHDGDPVLLKVQGRNQKSQTGRQQTGAQCWSHCSIFQLPQKAIWEECGGSRVRDQEEEVLLVLHLQPGRVHHTHRDDVHQPEPYRSPVYLVISIFSSSWLLHYSVLSFRKSLN